MDLGSNVSNHQHMQSLQANSISELLEMLAQVRIPFRIVQFYYGAGKHICVFECTHKIKKVNQKAALKMPQVKEI